jgi:hypothetical protein
MVAMFFINPIVTQAQFSGGSGTENDPYMITTAAQLAQLATYVNEGNTLYNNKYYKLGNNIDLSDYGSNFNDGKGWIPIGMYTPSFESPFQGHFNGDNYIITNLYINASNEDYKGLFGYVRYSTIKNLGVVGVNINGNQRIGSIVGRIFSSTTIDNCYATGTVNGDSYIGGLGGIVNYSGTIVNSYSAVTVTGRATIGGLVGYLNVLSKINNCYSNQRICRQNYDLELRTIARKLDC